VLTQACTPTPPPTAATSLIGVFKKGKWYLDLDGNDAWDNTPVDAFHSFGRADDKPVVGDWDGSGVTRVGVFRNGKWMLDLNGNGMWEPGVDIKHAFGGDRGDKPVVGDWDGSGLARIGIVRDGAWYLDMNGDGAWNTGTDVSFIYQNLAVPVESDGDDAMSGKPVVGDWDGSGITRFGVVSAGVWYLDINGDGIWDPAADMSFTFGPRGTPVTGAW
jgi:hypothetical protein